MFEKYFDGVIEQVYERSTKVEKNIVMACYNNSFSLAELESIKRYSENGDNVFFTWKEYSAEQVVGAYDPFLDIICQMYRTYIHEDFEDFLVECEVYELHKEILRLYFETGICKRVEPLLLDEVEYEQVRMGRTVAKMLKKVAEYKPLVIVINRFQMAGRSTIRLVDYLLEEPSSHIGIVLGVNGARICKDSRYPIWEKITEKLSDLGQIYHIGSSGKMTNSSYQGENGQKQDYEQLYTSLNNVIELLDFEQANEYLSNMERQIKFEEVILSEKVKLSMYLLHTKAAILLGDMPKVLDIVEHISRLDIPDMEDWIDYRCSVDIATCFMYQGKLEAAYKNAENAKIFAEKLGDEKLIFEAEVLMLRAQMAGWHNIFFCVKDVEVEPQLTKKMLHYNYWNHLAHVYIYAFDNQPEVVARAYHSESALVNFTKGIGLAKQLGNEILVYNAYQKNVMIASTNGMNEIALLYSIRTYQFIKEGDLQSAGRIFSAVGYNLSALGHMEESGEFYERAITLFYRLQLPEDIAEVCYNFSLTYIAKRDFKKAEEYLQLAMKTIDKLHLNSLRVCNLSKLYGLQSLLCTLQGKKFDAERYLLSCAQFSNYILEKQDEDVVHDFARSDDDLCMYLFAKAMQELALGQDEQAFADFEKTEKYFVRAKGNLFYIHSIYRQARMELFRRLNRMELFEEERNRLLQHEKQVEQISARVSQKLLDEMRRDMPKLKTVSKEQIENLVKQESLLKNNKQTKRQLDFISIWQTLLDKPGVCVYELVKNSIRLFMNYFNNDCAFYVRYYNQIPRVLYNDTGFFFSEAKLKKLEEFLKEYPAGIAISKISHTFYEHREMMELFDVDVVCSLVAVPFFKNGSLESFFITYIKMKDNWHDSVNRYLLNEDDLRIYQLLFCELGHTIHRLEAYNKIYQMNKRLQEAATKDVLTGMTNRMGMYQCVRSLLEKRKKEVKKNCGLGVMFLDLDNFKPYNDTYGHEVGDIVLKGMADIFKKAVGEQGFVVRYGGDEFIIITYCHEKDALEAIAKKIYSGIASANGFEKEIAKLLGREVEIDETRRISCSIGITRTSEFSKEEVLDEMINRADELLYSVKATGKGKYVFA